MQGDDLVRSELEVLTGSLIKGDYTPVLFELLKGTSDLKSLCARLRVEFPINEPEAEEPTSKLPSFIELFNNSPRVEDI